MEAFKILFLCLATFMVQASGQVIQSDQIRYEIYLVPDEQVPDVIPLPARGGGNVPNPLSNELEDLQDFYYPNLLTQAYNTPQPARGRVTVRIPANGNFGGPTRIGNAAGEISLLPVQQARRFDQLIANRLAALRNGNQVNWIVHATLPPVGTIPGRHLSHNIEI